MSQHVFTFGKNQVSAGWDRTLQYHFMTIINQDDHEIVYSNINDHNAGLSIQCVDYFIHKLSTFNIRAPDNYWLQIELDRQLNTGNFFKRW